MPRDLEGGPHTLMVVGTDARNHLRTVRIPFEIHRPFRPSMAGGSGLALLLDLLLTSTTGQLARCRDPTR